MMKLKEYISIFVFVAFVAGSFVYAKKQSERGAGEADPGVGGQIATQTGAIATIVKALIVNGSIPEDITFTGVHSPDDVFNNAEKFGYPEINAKNFLPPPEACSSSCSWSFLPAAKKDYGAYVYGVGTTDTDIIAYLPNMTQALCKAIDKGIGIRSIPKQSVESFDPAKPGIYSAKGSATTIKSQDGTLDGQIYGCFDNHVGDGSGSFSLYFVLHGQ